MRRLLSSRWPTRPPARDTTENARIAATGIAISSRSAAIAPVALIVMCRPSAPSTSTISAEPSRRYVHHGHPGVAA
jgi:hypothetical protein